MNPSKRFVSKPLQFALVAFVLFTSVPSQAWGLRGHAAICEAATFLVKDEALKKLLSSMAPRMAHLCNIPDNSWRGLDSADTTVGNPGHYINPESVGKDLKSLSSDYKKLVKKGDLETASKIGGLWWRAQQFSERATRNAKLAVSAPSPKNHIEEQDNELAYNKAIFEMIVDMGLMGHFVGDIAMPFHSRIDHDGRASGHGGIHSFYEDTCVNTFGPELTPLVYLAAQNISDKDILSTKGSVVDRMRAMSLKAAPEALKIEELDELIEPSSAERRVALRKPVAEACPKFREMMLTQMGRSARVLSMFWEESYKKGGLPKLEGYKSYRYPLQPDFVAPDYFDLGQR